MAETTTTTADALSGEEQLLRWKPRMGALSVAEKIETAEMLKRQANVFFKRGELKKALSVYAKVFAYVNGLSVQGDAMSQYAGHAPDMSATAAEGAQIRELKIAAWANMAFCHVKLGPERAAKALECCEKVLAEDPSHSKARFRKAQALAQLRHFERALAVLADLARAEPKNGAVRAELRRVQQLKKQDDDAARAKEKSAFANMFAASKQ
ncbi:hypothetical protein PybrP1_003247 [[Pythium] brassicae (nom. inval.)]|nr:hypothetical protein PybrP1_003247 [[Pythium] brassicae (nom. inval.)]